MSGVQTTKDLGTKQILFAGFGGQGILFAGKLLAYWGMLNEKEVSWLPSYGPEMRGGTANCSIIIADESIGSPLIQNPDILVAMNGPSLDKFEQAVDEQGLIIVDSSLIARKVSSKAKAFYIPATQIATENKMPKLANVIISGLLLRELGVEHVESLRPTILKCVPGSKEAMIEMNMKALQLGFEF